MRKSDSPNPHKLYNFYHFCDNLLEICHMGTVFPQIIAGGDYFYFCTKRGRLFEGRRLFEGGNYFKYFSQEVVKK